MRQQKSKEKSSFHCIIPLIEDQDQKATTKNANAQCKHCGRNNHQRKSSTLCPFFQGKANHTSTSTGITCASSVAGISLQRPAHQANQMDVSSMLTNHIVNVEAGTYNGICWTGDFRAINYGTWLLFRWWRFGSYLFWFRYFGNCRKADLVEFLDDDSSTLAGSEGDLDT